MRSVLQELAELREVQTRLRDLDHRIETMEENRARFAKAVSTLAAQAGIDTDQPTETLWTLLRDRLRQAEESEARRADQQARLTRALADLNGLTQESAGHQARVAQVCAFFGAADWPAARAALGEAARRATLRAEHKERAEELCDTLGVTTVEQALDKLDGTDATGIAAEIERLALELDPLQSAQEVSHAAYHEAGGAALAAVGGAMMRWRGWKRPDRPV